MRRLLLLCLFLLPVANSYALPIKFIFETYMRSSGMVGALDFPINTRYTVTVYGDTDARIAETDQFGASFFTIPAKRATLELPSLLPPTDILTPVKVVRNTVGTVSTVDDQRANGMRIDIREHPSLLSWDMLSSISATGFGYSEMIFVDTAAGATLIDRTSDQTLKFTAIVTPEPSALLLTVGSFLSLTLRRRR